MEAIRNAIDQGPNKEPSGTYASGFDKDAGDGLHQPIAIARE